MRSSAPMATAALLFGLAGGLAAQPCSDITRIDFRNSTIRTKQTGGILDSEFSFRKGVFNEMEEPGGSIVDWHFEITRDTIVHPAPNTTIRFIGISGNHLSGSGSRDYLIGFLCSDGAIENIFQQNGEGMRVIALGPPSLQLRFYVVKESDPHCCPSEQKDIWFSWDAASGTYVEKKQANRPLNAH